MLVLAVGGVVLVAAIYTLIYVVDLRKYKGVSMFKRHAIAKRGITAHATILDCVEVKTTVTGGSGRIIFHLCDLVLEVHREGQAPYRAPCRQEFIGSQWMDMREGKSMPVRIDPGDPQKVYVDVAARIAAATAERNADKKAHEQRQAELLNRK